MTNKPDDEPLPVTRPPSREAEDEICKCGYPGCLGHEVIGNHAIFPGFTSETVLERSPHDLIRFNVEVLGVAGNPSNPEAMGKAIDLLRNAQWIELPATTAISQFCFVDAVMTVFPDGGWQCGSKRGSLDDLPDFLAKFKR